MLVFFVVVSLVSYKQLIEMGADKQLTETDRIRFSTQAFLVSVVICACVFYGPVRVTKSRTLLHFQTVPTYLAPYQ